MSDKIIDYDGCFVCGQKNPCGLKLTFYYDEAGEKARAVFRPDQHFEGYRDLLHGGIISSVLDEVMIKAILHLGEPVVTSRLEVEFKSPVRIGEDLVAEGWMTERRGRLFLTEGHLLGPDKRLIARGRGVYVRVTGEMAERLSASLEK